MRQNADRAGFFGNIVVDLDIKASRRRNGAERAEPRRGRCRRGGGTPQRRNRAERRSEEGEVRKINEVSEQPEDYHGYISS